MKPTNLSPEIRTTWKSTLLAATAAFVLTLGPTDLFAAGQPNDTPVCMQFRDGVTDRVKSDGAPTYCENPTLKINSVIDSFGFARLNSNTGKEGSTTGRTMFLDFTQCAVFPNDVEGCKPPPLPETRYGADTVSGSGYPDRVVLRTHEWYPSNSALNLPIRNISKGHTVAHGFEIKFWVAGQPWKLDYGRMPGAFDTDATLVLITRLTDKTKGDTCNSWLVEAPSSPVAALDGNGNPAIAHDIARLTKPNPKNGTYVEEPSRGHYHMPFAMIVTDDLANQCP